MSLMSEFAEVMQKAENAIAHTMNTTFVDGLHEELERSVVLNVYAKYFPWPPNNGPWKYKRRGFGGIMSDKYNILTTNAAPGSLEIVMENIAPGNSAFSPTDGAGQPADSVENGGPWNYPLNPDPGPRPFMEKAAEMYIESGEAEAALVRAIQSI